MVIALHRTARPTPIVRAEIAASAETACVLAPRQALHSKSCTIKSVHQAPSSAITSSTRDRHNHGGAQDHPTRR